MSTILSKKDTSYVVPSTALVPLIDETGSVLKSVNPSQLAAASSSSEPSVTNDKSTAVLLTPTTGSALYILSPDGRGNIWRGVSGEALGTYSDDGGSFCGTVFIPSGGDGSSAWLRDYIGAIDVKAYGAECDGSNDDTAAFQLAFNSNTHVIFDGTPKITSDIFLDSTNTRLTYILEGAGTSSKLMLSGMTSGDYAFRLNESAVDVKAVAFPGHPRMLFKNFSVDGSGSTAASFLYHNECSFSFENLSFSNILYGAKGINYTDQVRMLWINWVNGKAGGRLYDSTDHAGDSFYAEQIFTTNLDIINLENCNGAIFNSCNGGRYVIDRCLNVEINGGHFEFSDGAHSFEIKNSGLTFSENYFLNTDDTYFPIYINDDLVDERDTVLTVKENKFFTFANTPVSRTADIRINSIKQGSTINLENNRGGDFLNDPADFADPTGWQYYNCLGIFITSAVGALNTKLQSVSGLLSQQLKIFYDGSLGWNATTADKTVPLTKVDTASIDSIAIEADIPTSGFVDTTTYYYLIKAFDAEYLFGALSAEDSIVHSGGATAHKLIISNAVPGTSLRIYRGTSTDTYDRYVDIPVTAETVTLFDKESLLANTLWITGAVVPSSDVGSFDGRINRNGLREIWSDSLPTGGEWAVGDIIRKETPTAGASPGWVCTTAGSGGAAVFKAMASIAA
jgi:hypothetical protein